MRRLVIAVGAVALLNSAGMAQDAAKLQEYAKQQDDLMKSISEPYYGVLLRIARGRSPFDQAAVDAALAAVEQDVGKIAKTFEPNPKENLPGADYGSSQKIWQNKADFDSKIPAVLKALADAKTSMKDVDTTKAAWDAIDAKCNACHDDYRLKLK
jgi:cytochrome c556